jgi:hypothetical protein
VVRFAIVVAMVVLLRLHRDHSRWRQRRGPSCCGHLGENSGKFYLPKNCGQALRLPADKKQKSNFPEYSPSVPPTGVDRTKQAVVYKGDMKREWPRMRPKEKNSGHHR